MFPGCFILCRQCPTVAQQHETTAFEYPVFSGEVLHEFPVPFPAGMFR
jgi:hypothetical protein